MSANTALITDAAKTAARHTLSSYSAGVFAHTTGDWGQHNVVRVYDQQFVDQAAPAHTVTTKTLRILATNGATDLALALPINPSGQDVLLTSAPIITVQPASLAVGVGQLARFVVGAISDTPMTYQWFKGGVAMTNQTANVLVIPATTAADAASYTVTVTNTYGSVTSAAATLSIGSGVGTGSDDGFDPLDIIFFPFSLF